MKPTNEVTALFVDFGLFLPMARRLAKDFKRTLYHCPAAEGFPTINRCIIGQGFPEIEKADDLWKAIHESDLVVFPDINCSDLQLELERQGKPVWGARAGDSLEIYRQKFHKVLAHVGLPVPTFKVIHGLTKLRDHLKTVEDKYIKISKYRGSLETTHWRTWALDEGWIDGLAVKFGPAKEIIPFLVFDKIETDIEIGSDTYCVDGQWPSHMLNGVEHKDKGYLGVVTPKEDMPEHLTDVLDAFSPILKDYRYRCQWSTEVRVKDDVGFFTDPTCRGGLPSTSSQLVLWENFAEIIWLGAHGELVDPKPAAKYSAECMISGKSNADQWAVIEVPKELRDWTNFGNCCQIDGRICFPPDGGTSGDSGWLFAIGDTIEEVIDSLQDHAHSLPDGLEANTDSMIELLKELHEAEKQDVPFGTQPIPEPATALDA